MRETVLAHVRAETHRPRAVLCDLSASPHVDVAGAEMLKGLRAELRALGIRMRIVEARSKVRDKLRAEGLADQADPIDRFTSVADAVEAEQSG